MTTCSSQQTSGIMLERLTELRQWAFAFARTRDKERTTLSNSSFVSNVLEYLPYSYSSILYHGKMATTIAPKKSAPRAHPPALQMVVAAVTAMKEKNGSSSQAIKKYIKDTYDINIEQQARFIRKALKTGAENGILIQTKGKGAAGSFKLDPAKDKAKAKLEKEKAKAKMEKDRAKKAELKAKKAEKAAAKKEKTRAAKSTLKNTPKKTAKKTPTKSKKPSAKKAEVKQAKKVTSKPTKTNASKPTKKLVKPTTKVVKPSKAVKKPAAKPKKTAKPAKK